MSDRSTEEVAIERAWPDDADALRQVDLECFGHAWTRGQYAGITRDPDSLLLLARADGKVVGDAWLQVHGSQAYIPTIGLLPAWRGRGLGGRLLDLLIAAARERGASRVTLEVRSRNEVAIRLYMSRGFTAIGRRKGLYSSPPDDALVMHLELAGRD